MVVLNDGSGQVMYQCRVLYIGSAPPIETMKGTEALQKPLRERYPTNMEDVEGIDATLSVLPDALQLTYNASGDTLNFPLSKLSICAAMRAVTTIDGTTGEQARTFVPVNTVDNDSDQPTIFSAIIRRTQGRLIPECHMLICNSTRDALHLVNTTATANMALKQGGRLNESTRYDNGIPVEYVASNGYAKTNGGVVNGGGFENGDVVEPETIYIKTSATVQEPVMQHVPQPSPVMRKFRPEPEYYKAAAPTPTPQPSQTIYVGFDKSNLVRSDESTLRVAPAAPVAAPVPRMVMRPVPQPVMVPTPQPVMVPAPQPVMVPRPRYVVQRPLPQPPRPVAVMRPRPMFYGPRPMPQPVHMPMPMPMPMPMRAPMPMPVRVPMPMPMPMVAPPPPQRMYARRVMSPPPRMYQQPVVVRSRARSASPGYGYRSEMKYRSSKPAYQPKWGVQSDVGEYRRSRIDTFDQQPRNHMYLNERAFSNRLHADNRFSRRDNPSYNYPTAYDMQGAMFYNGRTSKSNPRYSSSSDDEDDMRLSKSRK